MKASPSVRQRGKQLAWLLGPLCYIVMEKIFWWIYPLSYSTSWASEGDLFVPHRLASSAIEIFVAIPGILLIEWFRKWNGSPVAFSAPHFRKAALPLLGLLVHVIYALVPFFWDFGWVSSLYLLPADSSQIVLGSIVFYLLSVIYEEVFFRGLLIQIPLIRWGNTAKGLLAVVLAANVVFGWGHADNNVFGNLYISGIQGVMLAAICLCTGSLTASVLAHTLWNIFVLIKSILLNAVDPAIRSIASTHFWIFLSLMYTLSLYSILRMEAQGPRKRLSPLALVRQTAAFLRERLHRTERWLLLVLVLLGAALPVLSRLEKAPSPAVTAFLLSVAGLVIGTILTEGHALRSFFSFRGIPRALLPFWPIGIVLGMRLASFFRIITWWWTGSFPLFLLSETMEALSFSLFQSVLLFLFLRLWRLVTSPGRKFALLLLFCFLTAFLAQLLTGADDGLVFLILFLCGAAAAVHGRTMIPSILLIALWNVITKTADILSEQSFVRDINEWVEIIGTGAGYALFYMVSFAVAIYFIFKDCGGSMLAGKEDETCHETLQFNKK